MIGQAGFCHIQSLARSPGAARFGRFLLVGGTGFLADAGVLTLLLAAFPELGPFGARLISISLAMLLTWGLNRSFSFGPSSRGLAAEGARYGGVSMAASLLNYAAYSAALLLLPGLPPLLALAAGSAAAISFSFTGYSRLVFDR